MKTFFIIIIILAVIGVAVWWWTNQPTYQKSPENAENMENNVTNDSSTAINSDLDKIDVGSPEDDFQAIDNELNNL